MNFFYSFISSKMNNIKNRLISKEEVNNIINNQLKKKVSINDINLYISAFTHKSFLSTNEINVDDDKCCTFIIPAVNSYERLEFFGDSCLNFITAEYIYEKYPKKDEGFLTPLRTKLVRNTQLSYLGTKLGFNKWLLISTHIEKINGRNNPRFAEDVFEAFLGALYKDLGFEVVREFIYSCYDKYIDIDALSKNNDNYKDILLRYYQVNNWKHPTYVVVETGTRSEREFTSFITVNKNLITKSPMRNEIIANSEMIINQFNLNKRTKENGSPILDPGFLCIEFATGESKKISEQNVSEKAMKILKIPADF